MMDKNQINFIKIGNSYFPTLEQFRNFTETSNGVTYLNLKKFLQRIGGVDQLSINNKN